MAKETIHEMAEYIINAPNVETAQAWARFILQCPKYTMPIYVAAKTANRRDLKSYQVMKKDRDLVYSLYLTTMFDLQEAIQQAQRLNEDHLRMKTLLEEQGL